MVSFLMIVGGVALLLYGADLLVRSALAFAKAMKLSSLFIGLTVVAIGTSLPEMAISVTSSALGKDALCVGNVVGSNISNVLLIMGISAAVSCLVVKRQLLQFDLPVMLATSAALWLMALDGRISWGEGSILLAAFVAYLLAAFRRARAGQSSPVAAAAGEVPSTPEPRSWKAALQLPIGLVLLIGGSYLMVRGSVATARALGVSELLIGLTIVAVGTSLPELATSLMASVRKECDIAVGNVIGSNIANVLLILGLSAIAAGKRGIAVEPLVLQRDLPAMLGAALLCLPICLNQLKVLRWEGLVLLAGYALYLVIGIANTLGHEKGLAAPILPGMITAAVTVLLLVCLSLKKKAELDIGKV